MNKKICIIFLIIFIFFLIRIIYFKEFFNIDDFKKILETEKKELKEAYDAKNITNYWKLYLPLIFGYLVLFILNNKLNNKNQILNIFNKFLKYYKNNDDTIVKHVLEKINNINTEYKDQLINKIGGYFILNNLDNLTYKHVKDINNPTDFNMTLEKFIKIFNK
jgi:hypothetical protein